VTHGIIFSQNAEKKALKVHQAAKEHIEGMLYKTVLNSRFTLYFTYHIII